jgi:oligopeptide/dipeptide ABC transporter ATP-binding protein
MQLIYQDPYEALDTRCRVRAVLEEPLLIHHRGMARGERTMRVEQALAAVGLTPPEAFLSRHPHELSGGQRQRVAIAASIMLEPEFVVADEPVSMLDVSVRAEIMALLAGLCDAGMGVLLITHDLPTAARYADRIAVMYLGRIVEQGTPTQVLEHPAHPYTKALLAVTPRLDPLDRPEREALRGEVPDASDVPAGCRFHPRCPVAVERCRVEDPRLRPVAPGDGEQDGHAAACVLVAGDGYSARAPAV